MACTRPGAMGLYPLGTPACFREGTGFFADFFFEAFGAVTRVTRGRLEIRAILRRPAPTPACFPNFAGCRGPTPLAMQSLLGGSMVANARASGALAPAK